MAHIITTKGLYEFNKSDASAMDIRMAVFTGVVPSAAAQRDWDTVADVVASALVEAAAANYVRQDLASVTLTEVDGSDNVTLTAAAPTINSVGAGETWTCVVYYLENTGDTGLVLSCDEPAASIATNGGNITLPALSLTFAQA